MDHIEGRLRRHNDPPPRLFSVPRKAESFDWDRAYLAAVDALKRQKRKF